MEGFEILWKNALKILENTVSPLSYESYITELIPVDFEDNKLVLITKSKFFYDRIVGPLSNKITDALKRLNSDVTDFTLVLSPSKEEYYASKNADENSLPQDTSSPISPKFTFDSFVVGSSNEFIYAAAKAVAEGNGEAYNPLFIYGGSGLGKTHILMAIANYIRLHSPKTKVLYATCEQFTNQMIDSLSKGKITPQDFRNKFRNVDVLLIDDVQFLAKKQIVQTEFFNTFNELVLQNKQIVLTCDRPPKEIELLEDRLRTRFEGGLLADVQPPDLELRVAILRKKSEEQKCLIDLKVLTYIAELGDGDIRSLIGKLTKVIFASKLLEKPITVDLVKEALKDSVGDQVEDVKVDDIIKCVCEFYRISKADMLSKKKNKEFVEPRHVCIYLITDMIGESVPLEFVGSKIGGRDHSTIIYSRDKIAEQIKTDKKLATDICDMKNMLLKK